MIKLFKKNQKGFTLIELIVVIAIIGILAAIAIPSFAGISDQAEARVTLANATNIATAFNAYNTLNPSSQLGDNISFKKARNALQGINLWPENLTDDEAQNAWKLITVTNGVATASQGS